MLKGESFNKMDHSINSTKNINAEVVTDEKASLLGADNPVIQDDMKIPIKSEKQGEDRSGSVFSTIFNLTNAPMGAGMLSFPYTFYCTGFIAGLGITAVVVICSTITLYILIECSFSKGGLRSYQQCVELYLGKFWGKVCEIVLLVYATGICVVYLEVLVQFIQPLVELFDPSDSFFFNNHYMITLIFSCVVIFPLTLLRQIRKLGFTSLLALGGAIYLAIFMLYTGISHIARNDMGPGQSEYFWLQTKLYPGSYYPFLFLAIPLKCFGYQNHVLIFPISYELKKGTKKKMTLIMFISIFLITSVYLTTGIWGWFAFGTDAEDNILNNFSGADVLANICRFACGMNVLFSYPVQNYAARLAIQSLIWRNSKDQLSTFNHLVISTGYFVFVVLLGLFVPGISIIFGFIGSIGAVSLMFLFPSFLTWVVLAKKYPKWKYFYYVLSVFLFCLASFFCISGLIAAVFKLIGFYMGKTDIH